MFTISTSKPVEYIRIYVPWSNILNGSFVSDDIQLEEKKYCHFLYGFYKRKKR